MALVVYLSEEFTCGEQRPGTAIMYPVGLSYEHEGVAITLGKRYLLCGP
ncbi:MAG: hypothetical protein JWP63_1505, partial [Candidatus Solibacter sp.]|nr:hypothetical protein [Candidatus Solibacter sp.]